MHVELIVLFEPTDPLRPTPRTQTLAQRYDKQNFDSLTRIDLEERIMMIMLGKQ
jgi:hypothetical protein